MKPTVQASPVVEYETKSMGALEHYLQEVACDTLLVGLSSEARRCIEMFSSMFGLVLQASSPVRAP